MQRLALPRLIRRPHPATIASAHSSHHGLAHAVVSALAERRADVLRHLAQRHAPALMAQAMAGLTSRQRADILSLLGEEQRTRIRERLPHAIPAWLRPRHTSPQRSSPAAIQHTVM